MVVPKRHWIFAASVDSSSSDSGHHYSTILRTLMGANSSHLYRPNWRLHCKFRHCASRSSLNQSPPLNGASTRQSRALNGFSPQLYLPHRCRSREQNFHGPLTVNSTRFFPHVLCHSYHHRFHTTSLVCPLPSSLAPLP